MTQDAIDRIAKESGLANFIEPTNPAVLKFVAMVAAEKREYKRATLMAAGFLKTPLRGVNQ